MPNSPACPSHGLCSAGVHRPLSAEAEELKPILLTLNYVQLDADQQGPPATRELQVGCIRTTQPSPKKVMVALLLAQLGSPHPAQAALAVPLTIVPGVSRSPGGGQPQAEWDGCWAPVHRPQCHCLQTVEFSLDGVTWLQHKGFSIEPARGSVDRGQTKTISVSWVPPVDFGVGAGLLKAERLWGTCGG